MTDLAADAPAPETKSTTLDAEAPLSPSGAGAPKLEAEEPANLRDVIAAEAKKADEAPKPEPTAEEKPKDGPKPEAEPKKAERAEDGKFKAKEAEPQQVEPEAKAESKPDADKGQRIEPPKNFLPDAKETWRNTPRAVQRDVEQMTKRHEAEVTELRKATERYEALREFDELAGRNGRDLCESLTKLSQIEDLMQANPYAGLNAILQEIGPRKPDGTAPSLYEVAQFITQQGPEKWQQIVAHRAQPAQQPQNDNPEIVQLRQQVAQMQAQTLSATVIEPFKASHPRYEELREDIALFLKSGRIPADLSPADKLAAAYDMAERINPSSHVDEPADKPSPDADGRADPSGSSGSKSIKSAPGSVLTDDAPARGGSIRDLLADEFKRQKRA
jgi:hypothetical protein